MSLDIIQSHGGYRFECSTSEKVFGPVMPSFEVGDKFRCSLGKDARLFTGVELEEKWEEFQKEMTRARIKEALMTAYMKAELNSDFELAVFTALQAVILDQREAKTNGDRLVIATLGRAA